MFIQVCEKMVQRANVSWQLPVVIYRLGACSWRSTDGLGNPHDWVRCLSLLLLRSNYSNFLEFMCHVVVICHPQVTKLIAGCAHAHSAPPLHQDSLVNLAPVDKVAETFVALGAAGLFDSTAWKGGTSGEVFHIQNSSATRIESLLQGIDAAGFPLDRNRSHSEWIQDIQADKANPLFTLAEWFKGGLPSGPQFSSAKAQEQTTVEWPVVAGESACLHVHALVNEGLLQETPYERALLDHGSSLTASNSTSARPAGKARKTIAPPAPTLSEEDLSE